jgi:predicted TIM-barrel fold metal-dependent hydrolase
LRFGSISKKLQIEIEAESNYSAEEELDDFYDICEARGVQAVFHTGDISEGFKPERMETFLGNKAIGYQAQVGELLDRIPL